MFRISKKIFDDFPGFVMGLVVVRDADNTREDKRLIELLRGEEARIRSSCKKEDLASCDEIGVWREAYKKFGVKKNKYTSSVENLYRMVLDGKDVRHFSALVDIYNYISLKYMVPVGGEDLDCIKGDVELVYASADEPLLKLIGDDGERSPKEGEVIYKDETSAICRRWNWREADRTKLTEKTRNCILVVDALPPVSGGRVRGMVEELARLVGKYCGARADFEVFSRDLSAANLDDVLRNGWWI